MTALIARSTPAATHLLGRPTQLVDGEPSGRRERAFRPADHAGRLRRKFESDVEGYELLPQPGDAKDLPRRDAEKVGLRQQGQHGDEAVGLGGASRPSAGVLLERALERGPRRTVLSGQNPVIALPVDARWIARLRERMAASRDDHQAVVEQYVDLELLRIGVPGAWRSRRQGFV